MLRAIILFIFLIAFLFLTGFDAKAQSTSPQSQAKENKEETKLEEKERKKREKEAAKQAEREREAQEKEAKRLAKYQAARPIGKHSNYDRFKDVTTVTMQNMLVIGNNDYVPVIYGIANIWLTGAFQYQGQTWKKPEQIFLGFEVLEAYWEFRDPNNRNFILLVDGERMNLGIMGQIESNVPYVGNKETLYVPLSYNDFSKVMNAKTVEAQLGRLEFKLEPRHLEGLKNLIAQP